MAGVVTFDYATWISSWPEFAAVSPGAAANYSDLVLDFFDNTTANPAFNSGRMPSFYYMLVSHVAWLLSPRDANGMPSSSGVVPAPGLIGRISSASEGSVSVSSEWAGSGTPGESWYNQTQYGAMYWAGTAQWRTAQYLANPTFIPTARFPGYWRR